MNKEKLALQPPFPQEVLENMTQNHTPHLIKKMPHAQRE